MGKHTNIPFQDIGDIIKDMGPNLQRLMDIRGNNIPQIEKLLEKITDPLEKEKIKKQIETMKSVDITDIKSLPKIYSIIEQLNK